MIAIAGAKNLHFYKQYNHTDMSYDFCNNLARNT
jgi:hypothetical protein